MGLTPLGVWALQNDEGFNLLKMSPFFASILQKFRASYDFFLFAIWGVVVSLLVFSGIGWILYESNLKEWKRKSEVASRRITHVLHERLQETTQIMTYVGKKIALDPLNLEKIEAHFHSSELNSVRTNPLFTWVFFDWIDRSNRMRVNGAVGIFKDPPNMSHRSYTISCREKPWTLQVSPPAIGIPSGVWLIPIGLGVEVEGKGFLGIVSGGLQIDLMRQIFQSEIGGEEVEFLLIDRAMNIIVHSSGLDEESHFIYRKKIVDSKLLEEIDGALSFPLSFHGIDFYGLRKLYDYPYIVLTGFDQKVVHREFFRQLLLHFFEVLAVLFFCLMILYLYWRKTEGTIGHFSEITLKASRGELEVKMDEATSSQMSSFKENLLRLIAYTKECESDRKRLTHAYSELHQQHKEAVATLNLLKRSDESRERFMNRLNEEMQSTLLVILSYAKGLLKNAKGELDLQITEEQQIGFLSRIISAVSDLQNSVTPILNLVSFNLKTAIEEVLSIHSKEFFLKKVTLEYSIDPCLSNHFLDEVKFMQVVLGLLSRALQSVPSGGKVKVDAALQSVEGKTYFQIAISDDGFGLSEEDLDRLLEKFSLERERRVSPTHLDLGTIERLIEMHQGSLSIENTWRKGSLAKALFPFEIFPLKEDEEASRLFIDLYK